VTDSRDCVAVHLDAPELGPARQVGSLSRERGGAESVLSFAYRPEWVADPNAFPIDPFLPLYEGEQFLRQMPGVLADAAPDRWGRTLLERREAQVAADETRRPRPLDEWDFLVGVNDGTRMGALRLFRNGAFLDDGPLAVPPRTRLRELEQLAREVEEGIPRDDDRERWIAMLLAPGSSLGGARPKANFAGDDGSLWIAKFPSREDRYDVGAWEYVVGRLAAAAQIAVPASRLLRLASPYRTYCARRFDRDRGNRRLYASAMSLTGGRDHGEAGYLDIARAIRDFGDPDAIADDLRWLFRRVVFNVLVGNRDDHLRNHGFLRAAGGWRLAPAFDVNPSLDKGEHSLALDASQRLPDLDIVRETAPLYRLTPAEADEVFADVRRAVGGWREEARRIEVPAEEIDRMAAAFESG
jgi:serine/threonine-protein kinase HipA